MTISCSQCSERIGGHGPKCAIDGQLWCEKCVAWLEDNRSRLDAFNVLLEQLDLYEKCDSAQKRRAALAAGDDV